MRMLRYGVLAIVLVLSSSMLANATLLLDQHNDAFVFQGFTTPQTIGQSFVPALTNVAAVELHINDQNLGDGNGFGAYVSILEGSLAGPLLGTSNEVNFPDTPAGPISPTFPALFTFAVPIPVVPGNTYAIQVFPSPTTRGSVGVFVTGFNNDGYPSGTAFADVLPGSGHEPTDLWFRTYASSSAPEPGSWAFLLGGLALLASVAHRRRIAARIGS